MERGRRALHAHVRTASKCQFFSVHPRGSNQRCRGVKTIRPQGGCNNNNNQFAIGSHPHRPRAPRGERKRGGLYIIKSPKKSALVHNTQLQGSPWGHSDDDHDQPNLIRDPHEEHARRIYISNIYLPIYREGAVHACTCTLLDRPLQSGRLQRREGYRCSGGDVEMCRGAPLGRKKTEG